MSEAPPNLAAPPAAAPAPSAVAPSPAPAKFDSPTGELRLEAQWSPTTRQRSYAALLVVTGVAVVVLVSPFLDALLFASATVVVTWPIYERVLRATGQRTVLAAAFTSVGIGLLVLAPLTILGFWFVQEVLQFVNYLLGEADSGALRDQVTGALQAIAPLLRQLEARTGYHLDPVTFVDPLQRAVVTAGQAIARTLPEWVGSIVVAALDAFVYLFAVVTLYTEGPRFLQAVMRLSPMRKEHDRRLFEVFREFSTNLVFGALGTAAAQGMIASVGYAIAGVPNLVLVSLMTTVFGFVPFVGTSFVWVPVVVWALEARGWGWALFLLVWNLALTGSIDNLLRPFLLRGRSPIHPLPIFLSVIGGISWLGLPGALVGPVTVAMFLALHQIWCEQTEAVIPPPDRDPRTGPATSS